MSVVAIWCCRSKESAEEAINRVNGQYIGHRRVRCSWAQHKQTNHFDDFESIHKADPHNLNGIPPPPFSPQAQADLPL